MSRLSWLREQWAQLDVVEKRMLFAIGLFVGGFVVLGHLGGVALLIFAGDANLLAGWACIDGILLALAGVIWLSFRLFPNPNTKGGGS